MHGFGFDELLTKFRYPVFLLLLGLILTACGVFCFKSGLLGNPTKVEVLQGSLEVQSAASISAEVSGAVIVPGVYKLQLGSRVDDLLIVAGGFSADADRFWTDKYLNRAAKLTDGEKVYVPFTGKQSNVLSAKNSGVDQTVSSNFSSDSNSLININTASVNDLDSLPGIGPVYAQNIIDHRPYSDVSELLSKGALKSSVYNKIKDLVSVY